MALPAVGDVCFVSLGTVNGTRHFKGIVADFIAFRNCRDNLLPRVLTPDETETIQIGSTDAVFVSVEIRSINKVRNDTAERTVYLMPWPSSSAVLDAFADFQGNVTADYLIKLLL